MPLAKSQPFGLQIQWDVIEYTSVNAAPKTKYTQSFARSAIAPQTIASDTPANTTSNRYPVAPGIPVKNEYGALPIESISPVDGKKPCVPTIPLPSPNAIAKPNA